MPISRPPSRLRAAYRRERELVGLRFAVGSQQIA
jgi:hypothetical protein